MPGAVTEEVKKYAGRVDVATTRIGQKLASQAEALANAGTVAEVNAILEQTVSSLETLGHDPAVDPVAVA